MSSSWASCCVVLLVLSQAARAHEGSLEVLHRFNPAPEGDGPVLALVQGADGSFYGTTGAGGASGRGTIFKLDSKAVLTTLHSFVEAMARIPMQASPRARTGASTGRLGARFSSSIRRVFSRHSTSL